MKKTVQDTQAELLSLVEKHEQLVQNNGEKSNDILVLTAETNHLKQILAENKLLIAKYSNRLKEKDQEMHDLAEQLRDKNKVHLDYERTFMKDLKSKELDANNLTIRIQEL